MSARERHETHRQDLAHAHIAVLPLAHEQQRLHRKRLAHRNDQHPARRKLIDQGRWHVGGGRSDDDRVERRGLGPSVVAVPESRAHALVAESREPLARLPGQRPDDLDGVDG